MKKNRIHENSIERGILLKNYNRSRICLLIVIIITVVNIVLNIAGLRVYFPFSAIIPFLMGGSLICIINYDANPQNYISEQNIIPETEEYVQLMSAEDVITDTFVLVACAVCILAFYLIPCICSKKRVNKDFLFPVLILYIADTAFVLLREISLNSILDIVAHLFILVILFMGASAAGKLSKLPPDEEDTEEIVDSHNENTH